MFEGKTLPGLFHEQGVSSYSSQMPLGANRLDFFVPLWSPTGYSRPITWSHCISSEFPLFLKTISACYLLAWQKFIVPLTIVKFHNILPAINFNFFAFPDFFTSTLIFLVLLKNLQQSCDIDIVILSSNWGPKFLPASRSGDWSRSHFVSQSPKPKWVT